MNYYSNELSYLFQQPEGWLRLRLRQLSAMVTIDDVDSVSVARHSARCINYPEVITNRRKRQMKEKQEGGKRGGVDK